MVDVFDAGNIQGHILCELLQIIRRHATGDRDGVTVALQFDTPEFPVARATQGVLNGRLDRPQIKTLLASRND